MISAADFDDVFPSTPAPVCATLSGDRPVDASAFTERHMVPVFAVGVDGWAGSLPGGISHLSLVPQVTVETRERELAPATV